MAKTQSHWFAPIVVRPVPERPDRVTVGLVLGNGTIDTLIWEKQLGRLSGLMSKDHRLVFEHALAEAAESIQRFSTVEALRSHLGVQFEVMEPSELLVSPTRNTIAALKSAFFTAMPSPRDSAAQVIKQASLRLDKQLGDLPGGVMYVDKATALVDLYGEKIERHIHAEVPKVRRMLRGRRRDIVLNAIGFTAKHPRELDRPFGMMTRQFWGLRELVDVIRIRADKELELVGVVQPLPENASTATRQFREMVLKEWSDLVQVIDVDTDESAHEVLSERVAWVRG